MNISDLNPSDITLAQDANAPVATPTAPSGHLNLRDLDPNEVTFVPSEYSTIGQQALTGVESAARAGTLGTSDFLENQLASLNPQLFGAEARKGRMEENPWTSFTGSMLGGGALIAATGGVAAPFEAAYGAGGLAAATGAAFGAGNAVSDYFLGDPNLNAQKVLADVGIGAAMGVGLHLFSKAISQVPAFLRKAKVLPEGKIQPGEVTVPQETGVPPTAEAPTLSERAPETVQDMEQFTKNRKKYGNTEKYFELPQKSEFEEAANRLNPILDAKIGPYQTNSLSSIAARDKYLQDIELPGRAGESIKEYQGYQKGEISSLLDNTINKIAPDYIPTDNAVKAGERAEDIFTKVIQADQQRLGPMIKEIKDLPVDKGVDPLSDVIVYLTDPTASKYANPKIAKMFNIAENEVTIKPYKSVPGIDKATYNAVKETVDFLKQEKPGKIDTLFDIRDRLDQNINKMAEGKAAKEITNASAAMMDYIQNLVQKKSPNLPVRDIFRDYAINREDARFIQKHLGAEIGTGDFRSAAIGQSSKDILNKIFRSPERVAEVKRIAKDDFKKILSDYMSIIKKDITDKNKKDFSSNKFANILKSEEHSLNEAFRDNPTEFQRIKDSTTVLRSLADAESANPPHTARSMISYFTKNGIDPIKHFSSMIEYGKNKLEEQIAIRKVNSNLAELSDKQAHMSMIKSVIDKVDSQMSDGAKAIFTKKRGEDFLRGSAISATTDISDKKYNERVDEIQKFTSNPQNMVDHLANNTHDLYQAAPNVTQGIHTSVIAGATYLASVIPKPPPTFPLSQPWQPNEVQKRQFNASYNAVNDPISVLKDVKNGSVSNESIQALQAVHPQLLQTLREKVMENLGDKHEHAVNLPYATKISLSKFLGQPMDESLTPQGLLSNQAALNANLSQQSAPQSGRKSTVGGLKQLKLSSRTQSEGSKTTNTEK